MSNTIEKYFLSQLTTFDDIEASFTYDSFTVGGNRRNRTNKRNKKCRECPKSGNQCRGCSELKTKYVYIIYITSINNIKLNYNWIIAYDINNFNITNISDKYGKYQIIKGNLSFQHTIGNQEIKIHGFFRDYTYSKPISHTSHKGSFLISSNNGIQNKTPIIRKDIDEKIFKNKSFNKFSSSHKIIIFKKR